MEQKEVEFLRQELLRVHSEWELVLYIFGEDENHKIINEEIHRSVKAVFLSIHNALMSSVVHRISRFLDPMNTGRNLNKNKNISLDKLHKNLCEEKQGKCVELYNSIKKDWKNIKPLRDEVLAHNAKDTLDGGTDHLTWGNPHINSIIENINLYFESALEEDILGSVVSGNEGGRRFMKIFQLGIEAKKEEINKLNSPLLHSFDEGK